MSSDYLTAAILATQLGVPEEKLEALMYDCKQFEGRLDGYAVQREVLLLARKYASGAK